MQTDSKYYKTSSGGTADFTSLLQSHKKVIRKSIKSHFSVWKGRETSYFRWPFCHSSLSTQKCCRQCQLIRDGHGIWYMMMSGIIPLSPYTYWLRGLSQELNKFNSSRLPGTGLVQLSCLKRKSHDTESTLELALSGMQHKNWLYLCSNDIFKPYFI